MRSEYTKHMAGNELTEMEKSVEGMSGEELGRFRNSFEEDGQGFYGKECMDDDYQ